MRVLVLVKQVKMIDDEFALDADSRDVDQDYVDRALNEWDACAMEEALRLREFVGEAEIVALTVGEWEADDVLKRCLAMGADRAIRIDGKPIDPISTARALSTVVSAEAPDAIFSGVQSADSVQGATGVALAGILGLPAVAVVTELDWAANRHVTVHRELEGGLRDVVSVSLPAVLTIQTGINQPRYVTLRAIKQADQQEIEVRTFEGGEPGFHVRRMFVPSRTGRAEILPGSPAVVARRILEIVQERLA